MEDFLPADTDQCWRRHRPPLATSHRLFNFRMSVKRGSCRPSYSPPSLGLASSLLMYLPPAHTPGPQEINTDTELLEKAVPPLGLPQACLQSGSWAGSPSGVDLPGPAGLG